MELIGEVKNYHWGKLGSSSSVAQLALENRSHKFVIHENQPYAELWMGTHPSGPSRRKDNGTQLSSCLQNDLPFLFKILSIRKALSIQVHPCKDHAVQLNKEYPHLYQDPNHKPELAIAITDFTAMCGFRPYEEIAQMCFDFPPLLDLVGGVGLVKKLHCDCGDNLRMCYQNLMLANEGLITECIRTIQTEYTKALKKHNLLELFNTLNEDYPNDVGVLSLFFLNVIRLKPGEAIFLAAGEIHAYISGDCVECMACSDNVIRAGLTPKFKDVPQLLACLNYEGHPVEAKIFKSRVVDPHIRIFTPPVEEFAVIEIVLGTDSYCYSYTIPETGCILITLQGRREARMKGNVHIKLHKGSILYVPKESGPVLEFVPVPNMGLKFLAYIAFSNLSSVDSFQCKNIAL